MQDPVKDRIEKLRQEIAQISEANRLYVRRQKDSRRGRSRTSPSKIAGDPGRINVVDGLEEAMTSVATNLTNYWSVSAIAILRHRSV
jgi:hypothetical protein